MIPQHQSGFDTTILSDGENKSLGNILNEEGFIKMIRENKSNNKEKTFEVQALYYNAQSDLYEVFHVFEFRIFNNGESVIINLKENIKLSNLNKEIISNLLYFSSKIEVQNISMVIDRKCKDYVKILQGLMTVGFKTDNTSSSRFNSTNGTNCKILKMEMTKNDEVQEIDF